MRLLDQECASIGDWLVQVVRNRGRAVKPKLGMAPLNVAMSVDQIV